MDYIPYLEWCYGKKMKPVARRKECDIPDECTYPRCNAPKPYLYKNNGSKGQILCKMCSTAFSPEENRFTKPFTLRCPYCSRALIRKKERKQAANYCKKAALCVKPFVNHYGYKAGSVFTTDETYIKVHGVKGYVRLIMDAAKRSIIGYQASDNRGVDP